MTKASLHLLPVLLELNIPFFVISACLNKVFYFFRVYPTGYSFKLIYERVHYGYILLLCSYIGPEALKMVPVELIVFYAV